MGKTDPTRKTALDQLRARLISKKFGSTPKKEKPKKDPFPSGIVRPIETEWWTEGGAIYWGRQTGRDILRERRIEEERRKMAALRDGYGSSQLNEAVGFVCRKYKVSIGIDTNTMGDYTELHLHDVGRMAISRTEEFMLSTADLAKRIIIGFNLEGEDATIQSEPNKTESWTDKWLKENTSQK